MSELSTVAIKDGHRGHPHHHSHRQPLFAAEGADAERADRISRLAGLERVTTARQSSTTSTPAGGATPQGPGYFDPAAAAALNKERSTVGSASATGSVGGRTTWASGSDAFDNATDKMSEDQDMDASSTGGFSDEGNASLVGFGETASSTVSGPISSLPGNRTPQRHSLQPPRNSGMPVPQSRDSGSIPMAGVTSTTPRQDARMIDGMTTDASIVDSAYSGPRSTSSADAERILDDHMDVSSEGGMSGPAVHRDGQKDLGRFAFENGK